MTCVSITCPSCTGTCVNLHAYDKTAYLWKKSIFRLYAYCVIKRQFWLLLPYAAILWYVLDFGCSLSWHLLMMVCAWFWLLVELTFIDDSVSPWYSLLVELTLMYADLDVCLFFSAGVGRTGVFITLSIVLERMRYEGVVDMFQTVKMLRTQRPAMVQTEVRNTANCYLDLLA